MYQRRNVIASLAFSFLMLAGCATLPPGSDYPKIVSTALLHPGDTRLGQTFAQAARQNEGSSGFRIIPVGADGFLLRMQMINAAQSTIDVQYFIFRGDETGKLLTGALIAAADRGVRVRILVDDGDTVEGDEQISLLTAHSSVEVRLFNPFAYRGHIEFLKGAEFMLNAARLDYRMHNKLLVIDNSIALMGGRNIGDQYFQIDPQSQFADDDLFVTGPIAQALSVTFDEYWNDRLSIPSKALSTASHPRQDFDDHRQELKVERQELKAQGIDYVARIAVGEPFNGIVTGRLPLVWAHAQLVCDSPEKKNVEGGLKKGRLMQRAVVDATSAVQSELIMVTPYLIPAQEGMQMFQDLGRRKVRVRILTNSLESSTVSIAQAGYTHYRIPLLEAGVELYEIRSMLGNTKGSGQTRRIASYGNYSLHGKLFVLDRKRLFIGSMNFDQRSMHLNTEIGVIIDSPVLAQQVAARFDAMVQPVNSYRLTLDTTHGGEPGLSWHTQENGLDIAYSTEPARSPWQRFKVHFLSMLPLDSEL